MALTTQGALASQVAIVTGASSGIGAATARELARRGATVVLAARRAEELEAQAAVITAAGGQALVVLTDMTDAAQVARLAARTLEVYGRVDVLVNNAGLGADRAFARTAPEDITHTVQVNLLGTMLLTRALLPEMLRQRRGAIIAVASVAGLIAAEPIYSATKYGVRGFMLSLRRQVAGSGVSVSLVSPGFIRTPLTRGLRVPLMPGPEVVARRIARLITHPRREVVVPRYYRVAVFFERTMPWLVDLAFRPRGRGK
ncbi:MAG: SDR family NAD(P)-dependent oxidoreductase [Ktedonobacterales bacterium]|nr:SDR family NAD(P)-dependent oxidoreductase [Ktedonobacterales bacterium]